MPKGQPNKRYTPEFKIKVVETMDEWSYCTNQANGYSISIECCHPDNTGKFTDATETSLAELCVFLCKKFGLTEEDIIRHYDVTGKQCPLYWSPTKYVSKEIADGRFNAFRSKVAAMLGKSTKSEPFPYKVKRQISVQVHS